MGDRLVKLLRGRGIIVLILAVVIVAGAGVLDNGFVNYDDPQVLLVPGEAGELAPSYGNLTEWLVPSQGRSWLPLRFLVFSILYSIVGPSALVFHLLSLALYAVICLQVYVLAHRLLAWDNYRTGDKPWRLDRDNFWPLFAAAAFALNPLNVECLAWVSALKDLLFAVFWLAFVLSITSGNQLRLSKNRAALIYFLLALAAKPPAVMLPLLVLAFFLLGPDRKRPVRFPWKTALAVSLLSAGYLAILLPQISGMRVYTPAGGFDSIVAGALKALFAYAGSFLVPAGLSVRYLVKVPLSLADPATLARAATLLALCVLAGWLWVCGRRFPALALAWCLLAFLPSSGLLPLGILRADRYALTLAPIFALGLSYGLREMSVGLAGRAGTFFRAAIWIIPLCFMAMFVRRVDVWRDSGSLWADTLARDSGNWIALNGLAHWQLELGDTTGAVSLYEKALEVNPNSVLALNSLAVLAADRGDFATAECLLKKAAELRGYNLRTSMDLARLYLRTGRPYEAAELLERHDATGIENAEMHYLLSILYRRTGHLDWAASRMKAARALDPGNHRYRAELGRLMVKRGNLDDAIRELSIALDGDPDLVEAYVGFGDLFLHAGQPEDAARSYHGALVREPDNRDALLGMAGLMGTAGKLDSAAVLLEKLRKLHGSDCLVLANSVALAFSLGNFSEGAAILNEAIACDSNMTENYLNGYNLYLALDSLGRAAEMLSRAQRVSSENQTISALEADISARTGVPADTAIKYLSKHSRVTGERIMAEKAAALIDSLRNSP